MAFEIAASLAFKEAFPLAGPVLLEPIVSVQVRAPEHLLGTIANDLSARGGTIEGIEHNQMTCLARATVPLRTMLGYVTGLRSLTSGRGTFTMELQRYAPIPETAAAEIIHAAAKRRQ
jgi:elongation factor G